MNPGNPYATPQAAVLEAQAMTLRIRPESHADSAGIEALTSAAFLNAAHSSHTEQYIVEALRRAGQLTVSLVAEQAGELLGHAAISPVSLSDGPPDWYGLGPISVLPAHQGRGIGTQLMHAALAALRKQGAAGCVVLGNRPITGASASRPSPTCGWRLCRRSTLGRRPSPPPCPGPPPSTTQPSMPRAEPARNPHVPL